MEVLSLFPEPQKLSDPYQTLSGSGVPMIRWYRLAACWKLPIPIIDCTFSQSIFGKLIDAACFQLTTWGKTNSYLLMYSETILEYSRKCFHSV